MAFNSLMNPRDYASWEQDPSTRESIRLLTKAYPVDSTLSVAGTAKDLISVAPGLPTVNMITNPSMETGNPPTGYTALRSAVLAQDAVVYKYGLKSMKITPPNAARGEGALWALGEWSMGEPLSISAYFSDNAASGKDARVELIAVTTPVAGLSNIRFGVGTTATFAGAGWYRSTFVMQPNKEMIILWIGAVTGGPFVEDETITGDVTGVTGVVRTVGTGYLVVESLSGTLACDAGRSIETENVVGTTSLASAAVKKIQRSIPNGCQLGVAFVTATKHATVFYVDGAQAESNFNVTDYCDGAQGYYNWWDGTAHASTSRRWRKMSSIRSMRLHTSRDVYVAYDMVADRLGVNAEDRGEFLPAGTDWGENSNIYLNKRISYVNVNPGELPRITGLIWGV